jgi:SAM-dependent methyltransferase
VAACSQLFSAHYGTWGAHGTSPGQRIRLPHGHFLSLLRSEHSWIVSCYIEDELVGYVVAHTFDLEDLGPVAWISQLVVHETYRNARLATILLRSIWEFSDYYAWGLVTANPFAVRALEAASRRRVRRRDVRRLGPAIASALAQIVDYIPPTLKTDDQGREAPVVDTKFFVSHNELPNMQKNAARSDRPWELGNLEEGEEWFACTFREQAPFPLNTEQWDAVLRSSEQAWIDAYERMTLDEAHRWHAHAAAECDWILNATGLRPDAAVIDVGCGDGRHSHELAARGFRAAGVDIAPSLIARASETQSEAVFAQADARVGIPGAEYAAALCLYDVLGSSTDPSDDERILLNIRDVLRSDGLLVVSVMNELPLRDRLEASHVPRDYDDFVQALDQLPPSRTMQNSGDVHDPTFVLYYDGSYYRKEQFFNPGDRLPREVVVRDRRFTPQGLTDLLERCGLAVRDLTPVQAGAWTREPRLGAEDLRAKELLAICQKV